MSRIRTVGVGCFCILLSVSLSAAICTSASAAVLTVFAAASLKEALDDQVRRFETDTKNHVVVSYAASNALAKQIESGAPADVFLSADLDWMDYLGTRKLLRPDTRTNLLSNRLVLIEPGTKHSALQIGPGFGLAGALGSDKLAMANTDSVPAGKYGKAALENLGVWASVEPRVVRADNVRAALAFVARNEAAFGIVYTTDALAEKNVRIVDTFPESSHPPIVYPAAIVASSKSEAAGSFLYYLRSSGAATIWKQYGFATVK